MKKSIALLLATVLLLASVVSMFIVQAEGSAKPVAPDELIATFNVNTGAVYAGGSHTVLAKIGENTTIEKITGYLLDGAGKDYNYFFVYAVEEDANGNYVITAEYEILGRDNEGGPKSDVKVPENGYLVCISAADPMTDDERNELKDGINVGDIVVFEGFELEALTKLQPKENPLKDAGKVSFYTAKEVEEPKVPDGDVIATFNVNTGAVYAGGSHTVLAAIGENTTIEKITGYLLDGAGKDYNYFFVYAVEKDADGDYVVTAEYEILGRDNEGGPKSDVKVPENGYLVCISAADPMTDDERNALKDGINVGDVVVFEGFDPAALTKLQPKENPLKDAGKVSFYPAKEVEDDSIAAFDVNTGAVYAGGSHTVLAAIGENTTIEKITGYLLGGAGKDYNYFFVYAVEKDADGDYVVTAEYEILGRDNEGGPKSDVKVPENGYLVCISAADPMTDDERNALKNDINVGNVVVFEGFDPEALTKLQPKENPLEGVGKVSFYPAKEVEEPDDSIFVFDIKAVNGTIAGEDAIICTTQEAYNNCNPKWAVTVLLKVQEDGTLVVAKAPITGKGAVPDVKVGDGIVALVVHSSGNDPAEYPNAAAKVAALAAKVGMTVVLEGIDLEKATGSGTASLYASGSENVASGKDVEIKKAAAIPQYSGADLTDGVISTGMSWGSDPNEWFSFYYNESYADQVNVTLDGANRIGFLVIDLEDYYDLDSVRIHFNKGYLPQTTNIYTSTNGKSFKLAATKTNFASEGEIDGQGQWVDFPLDELTTAQYVKVEVIFTGMFAMLDEVEVYGVSGEYTPRVPAGEVVVDGKLDDSAYEDETAAPWYDHALLQNAGAPQPDLSGKFTARSDDEYISVAVQIKNTIAPNILDSYKEAIAKAGKLAANNAQANIYVQTGATTFRIWLRANATERYLIDVQYLGEEIGWVATRAIFPTGSTLTWADLEVVASVDYTDGTLTAEFAFPKVQFGVTDQFGMFITYSDNFTDETYTNPTYQCFHLCSTATEVNADGYIANYSGNVMAPYIIFEEEFSAVEAISFEETLDYVNLGAATLKEIVAGTEDDYSAESWAAFAKALADAKAALKAKECETQADIDALAAALLAAYDALEAKPADYTAVEKAIEAAEKYEKYLYTEESWKALQDAIDAVDYTLRAPDQDKVDAMAKAIEDATAALTKKDADYTVITELKRVADALNKEDYTEETWAALQAAIEAVVEGKKIDEQDSVNAMAKAISDAIIALVKVEPKQPDTSDETSSEETSSEETSSEETSSEETPSEETSSEETSSEESKPAESSSEAPSTGNTSSTSPETGDSGIVVFAIIAVLSLAGAIVTLRVRR